MKRWLLTILVFTLLLSGCAPSGPPLPPLLATGGAATVVPAGPSEVARVELQPTDLLPLDPSVRTGVLDNGLRFYIQHNAEPAQRADLWLAVNAGSVLEEDDQQGLAHFLEHMLFNGTRNFPAQALIDYLESTGMEFGPDINAYTSFDETVYTLQVPTDDAEILATAFDVLEDWAAHATLDPQEIDAERGVVVEEWRLGSQNAEGRLMEQMWPLMVNGSQYAERLPIGQMDVVLEAPPEATRRFYETWYRPEQMSVIAVGDFDVDRIEALVRQHFSALPASSSPVERPSFDVPSHAESRYLVARDAEYPYTDIQVMRKTPAQPLQTVADFREDLAQSLALDMLNIRLDDESQQDDAPFVYAFVDTSSLLRPLDVAFLRAQVQDDGVLAGLEAALTELARVRQHGFTPTELERAKDDLLRAYQRYYDERDNIRNENYAAGYLDHWLTGEASPSLAVLNDLVQQLLPQITLEEVNRQTPDLLAEENRIVIITAPDKEDLALPGEDELSAVFDRVARAEVAAYEDAAAGGALMAEPPQPAAITAERTLAEVGVTEIELANGVRVVMKPTDFRADQVLFSATSPGGSSLVSDDDFPEASAISYIVSQSGVDQFSRSELQKLLAGKVAGAGPGIDELSEGLGGYASPQDLETLFQLIHLYVTRPRVDEAAFQAYLDQERAFLANRSLTPLAALEDALEEALHGDALRFGPLPLEAIEQIDLQRAFEIYKERFADMGDATFVFVGNFDPEQLKSLAQTYLGTLPSAGRQETWRDVSPPLPEGVVVREVFKGQEDQSIVQIVFTGPAEVDDASQVRLSALEALLSIRLREELREERSGTYAPFVSSGMSLEPRSEYSLSIGFGTAPERAEELSDAMFAVIEQLKAEGPAQVDMDKIKQQSRRNRQESLEDNYFWLDQLEYHLTTPGEDVQGILEVGALVDALTPQDIQSAAQAFLPADRYVKVVLYPENFQP